MKQGGGPIIQSDAVFLLLKHMLSLICLGKPFAKVIMDSSSTSFFFTLLPRPSPYPLRLPCPSPISPSFSSNLLLPSISLSFSLKWTLSRCSQFCFPDDWVMLSTPNYFQECAQRNLVRSRSTRLRTSLHTDRGQPQGSQIPLFNIWCQVSNCLYVNVPKLISDVWAQPPYLINCTQLHLYIYLICCQNKVRL